MKLKKLQEDQVKLKKQIEYLEKSKAEMEAARQESARQLTKTKQELEEATAQANVVKAGEILNLKSQLAEENDAMQELKNKNKRLLADNNKLKEVNHQVNEENMKRPC